MSPVRSGWAQLRPVEPSCNQLVVNSVVTNILISWLGTECFSVLFKGKLIYVRIFFLDTSRPRRTDEKDGEDYHFISRPQFEQDILARRFVEHGEYEKSYYGTSLEAIRSVVYSEKICVLNLHPQSLKILKNSDLMPYVVFVAPPSLEKLKRWKIDHSEPINDDELREIIERAREMEETYGHYFDMIIIYSDPDRAYQQLLSAINSLERESQWVPASWLSGKADTM